MADFAYMQTDVPPGMTLREWSNSLPRRPGFFARLRASLSNLRPHH